MLHVGTKDVTNAKEFNTCTLLVSSIKYTNTQYRKLLLQLYSVTTFLWSMIIFASQTLTATKYVP